MTHLKIVLIPDFVIFRILHPVQKKIDTIFGNEGNLFVLVAKNQDARQQI